MRDITGEGCNGGGSPGGGRHNWGNLHLWCEVFLVNGWEAGRLAVVDMTELAWFFFFQTSMEFWEEQVGMEAACRA